MPDFVGLTFDLRPKTVLGPSEEGIVVHQLFREDLFSGPKLLEDLLVNIFLLTRRAYPVLLSPSLWQVDLSADRFVQEERQSAQFRWPEVPPEPDHIQRFW